MYLTQLVREEADETVYVCGCHNSVETFTQGPYVHSPLNGDEIKHLFVKISGIVFSVYRRECFQIRTLTESGRIVLLCNRKRSPNGYL
jgi:hypothetical protein